VNNIVMLFAVQFSLYWVHLTSTCFGFIDNLHFRVETHKNDVLQFCQSMWASCRKNYALFDRDSAELLWRFLELLIKQNGVLFSFCYVFFVIMSLPLV